MPLFASMNNFNFIQKLLDQTGRVSIGAWIAAAGQNTGIGIAQDDLASSKERSFPPAHMPDAVTAGRQIDPHGFRNAVFQCNFAVCCSVSNAKSAKIKSCLRIEPTSNHCGEDLYMPLGLHKSTHNPKGCK